MVATVPDNAVATIAAATSPNTRVIDSRRNREPKKRWTMSATTSASPALHSANTSAVQALRSPSKLATMVAAIVPTMTGSRTFGPSAINTPDETPAAGQNTATPSGREMSARLRRAARKWIVPIAAVRPSNTAQDGSALAGKSSRFGLDGISASIFRSRGGIYQRRRGGGGGKCSGSGLLRRHRSSSGSSAQRPLLHQQQQQQRQQQTQ